MTYDRKLPRGTTPFRIRRQGLAFMTYSTPRRDHGCSNARKRLLGPWLILERRCTSSLVAGQRIELCSSGYEPDVEAPRPPTRMERFTTRTIAVITSQSGYFLSSQAPASGCEPLFQDCSLGVISFVGLSYYRLNGLTTVHGGDLSYVLLLSLTLPASWGGT